MKICGMVMPVHQGIIILLLVNLSKIVQGKCWEEKFKYKFPHSESCGLCRICPPNIINDPKLLKQHLKKECENLQALPEKRLPHCHSIDFEKPSCKKWEPQVGSLECNDDNTVYTICQLKCPPGYKASSSVNVTCKSELKWDAVPLPVCVAKNKAQKNQSLGVGAIICIVVVAVAVVPTVAGIVVFRFRKAKQQRSDLEQGNQVIHSVIEEQLEKVVIFMTNAKKDPKKQKWIVKRGSIVTVSAESQSVTIQYLVFLKTGSKHRRKFEQVYTSIPGRPAQIELEKIQSTHHGYYDWIAGLADGKKERGRFKIAVKEPSLAEDMDSGFVNEEADVADENTSLTSTEEKDTKIEITEAEPREDTNILTFTDTEDKELQQDANDIEEKSGNSGFMQLMKCRRDVRILSTLLDREGKNDEISWHVIAVSDLLGYDEDTVCFLEYHLKGKLYKGPMSYILTLMKQQGTTIEEFVEFLKKYQPSSNKAIGVLEKYL